MNTRVSMMILAILLLAGFRVSGQITQTFAQAATTFYVTADHTDLEPFSNPLSMPAGSMRYTLVSVNNLGEPTSFATNYTVRMIVRDLTDSNAVASVIGSVNSEFVDGNRLVFPVGSLFAKEYLLEAFRWNKNDTSDVLRVAAHHLIVTNSPAGVNVSVGATTVNSTNVFYYSITNIFEMVTQILSAGVFSVQGATGAVTFAAQTTSNPVGYVEWSGLTLLVGTNTAGLGGGWSPITFTGPGTTGLVTSATGDTNKVLHGDGVWRMVDATTLEGLNAQSVADLTRSTADVTSYYPIAWSPTVTVLRANGPRQVLIPEGPTWVSIPAGSTNAGFTIRLEIAPTTNQIEFLPANIIISTNITISVSNWTVALIDNAFREVKSAVYGLPRGQP